MILRINMSYNDYKTFIFPLQICQIWKSIKKCLLLIKTYPREINDMSRTDYKVSRMIKPCLVQQQQHYNKSHAEIDLYQASDKIVF